MCRNEEDIEAEVETQKAKNRKILLEMIGDRPDADAKAPEEFLFVCKLNPITNEEDLETIFSRFGEVIACDVIRDKKTGDSLNYAFIGFTEKKSAEEAYLKMNNALIDDRFAPVKVHVELMVVTVLLSVVYPCAEFLAVVDSQCNEAC